VHSPGGCKSRPSIVASVGRDTRRIIKGTTGCEALRTKGRLRAVQRPYRLGRFPGTCGNAGPALRRVMRVTPARSRVFPVSGTGWPGTGCGPRPGLCWSRSLRPIARNGARTMRSRMVSKDRHRLRDTGHHEGVDGDVSHYFGEIPHADRMTRVARRIRAGSRLTRIRAWLEMPTEETEDRGGKIRSARARAVPGKGGRAHRFLGQSGAPVAPPARLRTRRRCIRGWTMPGDGGPVPGAFAL